uniref:C-type lectin domain-containing protein n=1 Tax=Cyprinodon variegatus TaxID=28743 RepID=A0A3Q2FL81_CYPVA
MTVPSLKVFVSQRSFGLSMFLVNCFLINLSFLDLSPHYVYIKTQMNWTDAQKYCRANYIDLASVRSESENEAISQLVTVDYAWIGLYKESWRWSDGQRLKMTSFSKWNPSQSITVENSCVTTTSSVWNIRPCSSTFPFICRGELNKFDWDRGQFRESSIL